MYSVCVVSIISFSHQVKLFGWYIQRDDHVMLNLNLLPIKFVPHCDYLRNHVCVSFQTSIHSLWFIEMRRVINQSEHVMS